MNQRIMLVTNVLVAAAVVIVGVAVILTLRSTVSFQEKLLDRFEAAATAIAAPSADRAAEPDATQLAAMIAEYNWPELTIQVVKEDGSPLTGRRITVPGEAFEQGKDITLSETLDEFDWLPHTPLESDVVYQGGGVLVLVRQEDGMYAPIGAASPTRAHILFNSEGPSSQQSINLLPGDARRHPLIPEALREHGAIVKQD